MLETVLSQITKELKNAGLSRVYTVFDNIPADIKGGGVFAVVEIERFESTAPIYSEYSVFMPFRADAGISLIAPATMNMAQLYDVFDRFVLPLADSMGSLTCSLKSAAVKKDGNIGRLVLKAEFSVSGISKHERSIK